MHLQKKAVRTVWSGSVFGGPPNSAAPWAGSITLKVSANPVSEACPKTGASLGERGGRPKGTLLSLNTSVPQGDTSYKAETGRSDVD